MKANFSINLHWSWQKKKNKVCSYFTWVKMPGPGDSYPCDSTSSIALKEGKVGGILMSVDTSHKDCIIFGLAKVGPTSKRSCVAKKICGETSK